MNKDPAGDAEAQRRFTELYAEHYWTVYRYCVRRVDNPDDARDATAHVFTVAWQRRADVPDAALGWLLGTARRVLANSYRSTRRWRALLDKLTATADVEAHDTPAANDDVMRRLTQLNSTDQEILQLAFWDDIPLPDIADALGISYQAAATRLHRAKNRFADGYHTTHHVGSPCAATPKETSS